MNEIETLNQMIQSSSRIVFLGGAGVSTESGIPDFRSENGYFTALKEFGEPPEVLLSHDYFMEHPDKFYQYYRKYLMVTNAKPNPAHYGLVKLEKQGKLAAVITQNIDGLHRIAGSKTVLELHGTIYRNFCIECNRIYKISEIQKQTGIPHCSCGGIIRPDIVLYNEDLDSYILNSAKVYVQTADMLIVGGTSLAVYPAAGLVNFYFGKKLVLINKSETPYDHAANLIIRRPIGEVFQELMTI